MLSEPPEPLAFEIMPTDDQIQEDSKMKMETFALRDLVQNEGVTIEDADKIRTKL